MADFQSLVDVFRSHVRRDPDKVALAYLYGGDDGVGSGVDGQRLSYAELDRRARSLAVWLRGRYRPGDRALLLFPTGLEFTQAFVGCLYAGLVPVPAPLPGNDIPQIERTTRIALDAEVALALTTTSAADPLRAHFVALRLGNTFDVVAFNDATGDEADWVEYPIGPDTLALLQYTSGSTSEPRGVMVTQANLVDNLTEISRQGSLHPADIGMTWLPHFHDMGLIGTLLHPLHLGSTNALMSPVTFLRRPARWLQAMSHWRATHTTAPDFAYEVCARVVTAAQVADLDLSAMRWAVNGAEPVRSTTLTRFAERFASIGFRYEALSPCYGLAESTLLVSTSRPGTPPVMYRADRAALERDEVRPDPTGNGRRLVSCGLADPATTRAVDPQDRTVLSAGQVGEIWLIGPSVAAGYWRQPDATEEYFGAHAADGTGPYLRTGDLGSIVDGNLYITGRMKDVVIVHGRNLYPQDIEYAVRELHPALGAGGGVVFAVSQDQLPGAVEADGREHIVVIHEIKKGLLGALSPAELVARVKVAVVKAFDVPSPSVVLTNRGGVHRTTSGKVQRRLMRRLFLEQRLDGVHEDVTPAVRALRLGVGQPVTAAGVAGRVSPPTAR